MAEKKGEVDLAEEMSLDEVIAANVKRIRKRRGLSVQELALRLDVSRALAYDMEGPREGREQRQFTWSDLFRLCEALRTNLFELVLPPEDSRVVLLVSFGSKASTAGETDAVWSARLAGRSDVAEIVFGGPVKDDLLANLERAAGRRADRLDKAAARMKEQFEALLMEMEEE